MCDHYKRNCKVLCNICCNYYSCRFCHDTNENHQINRHNINWIKCLECDTEQISKQECIYCHIIFGKYYCKKCGLFDNADNKDIFHCDKCGICRLGKSDNYYHCDICNCCYSNSIKNTHKCIPNSTHNDCCICLEYMFYSRESVSILKCGHTLHSKCFNEYIKTGSYITCPLCKDYLIDIKKLNLNIV